MMCSVKEKIWRDGEIGDVEDGWRKKKKKKS